MLPCLGTTRSCGVVGYHIRFTYEGSGVRVPTRASSVHSLYKVEPDEGPGHEPVSVARGRRELDVVAWDRDRVGEPLSRHRSVGLVESTEKAYATVALRTGQRCVVSIPVIEKRRPGNLVRMGCVRFLRSRRFGPG